MYISIKLPPAFGSFNRLRKENYPFNNLFTSYLAAVSRLGLALQVDVEELVGYIEDRVFEGQRLPDVPEGDEPVNFRYKTEDPDVVAYIGGSSQTNRMAVMYIARMTLRLSVAYGTSLFRLTRLINSLDISDIGGKPRKKDTPAKQADEAAKAPKKTEKKPPVAALEDTMDVPIQERETQMPMPRIRGNASGNVQAGPVQAVASVQKSAEAARAAVNALVGLTAQADSGAIRQEEEDLAEEGQENGGAVETSPYLNDFF